MNMVNFHKVVIIGESELANKICNNIKKTNHVKDYAIISFDEQEKQDLLESADFVMDLNDDCSMIVERVKNIENNVSEKTVIAAYSPKVSTTEIMSHLNHPARFVGTHFFRLGFKNNLVEIVRPERQGNEEILQTVSSFFEKSGYVAVIVKDRPGLLADRLIVPYFNQVAQAFDEGIASAIDIDNSVHLGLGYPVGPLALLDKVGIDKYVKRANVIHEELDELKYKVPPVLKRKVSAQLNGERNGEGFYQYGNESK
jgi:3-hydroxybutyryl-CoA dehydrogenase